MWRAKPVCSAARVSQLHRHHPRERALASASKCATHQRLVWSLRPGPTPEAVHPLPAASACESVLGDPPCCPHAPVIPVGGPGPICSKPMTSGGQGPRESNS